VALRVAPDVETNRVLTLPNVITFVRLACLPVFLWLLFVQDDRLAAAVLLAVLGITDFVDGYIARRFHQVSELGKVLDPTADRLLFIVGVGGIMIDGAAPLWFSLLVLAREVVVGAAMVILTALGMKRVDVSWWGKAGTLALMVSFPSFLASEAVFRYAASATAASSSRPTMSTKMQPRAWSLASLPRTSSRTLAKPCRFLQERPPTLSRFR
jgi:cardiolipin synthase